MNQLCVEPIMNANRKKTNVNKKKKYNNTKFNLIFMLDIRIQKVLFNHSSYQNSIVSSLSRFICWIYSEIKMQKKKLIDL